MSTLLLVIGLIFTVVGGLWLLGVIFQESVLWGLVSLFIPIVGLVFALMHWEDAKRPFLTQLTGVALIVLGAMLAPPTPGTAVSEAGIPTPPAVEAPGQ